MNLTNIYTDNVIDPPRPHLQVPAHPHRSRPLHPPAARQRTRLEMNEDETDLPLQLTLEEDRVLGISGNQVIFDYAPDRPLHETNWEIAE